MAPLLVVILIKLLAQPLLAGSLATQFDFWNSGKRFWCSWP